MNPKDDAARSKPSLRCMPWPAVYAIAEVLQHGARKHRGPCDWREREREDGVRITTYLDAVLRHIAAHIEGEDLDPESGRSHLAHAAATLVIVLDAQLHGTLVDDRHAPAPAGARGF